MSTWSLDLSIVRRLVAKDLWLYRWELLGLGVGVPGLGLLMGLATSQPVWSHLALIVLNNALIYLMFFLPIVTVVNERKLHTLVFVMSLPVSYREYTASKLVGSGLVFGAVWLAIGASLPGIIAGTDEVPTGSLPLIALIMGALLLLFVLTVGASLVTESLLWTMVVALLAVVLAFAFFPLLGSFPKHLMVHWIGDEVIWDRAVLAGLGLELGATALVVLGTFALQSRKQDFL